MTAYGALRELIKGSGTSGVDIVGPGTCSPDNTGTQSASCPF
ncbi:MAG: hypothetical protein AAGI01_06885 [Myxococcota bacterium]